MDLNLHGTEEQRHDKRYRCSSQAVMALGIASRLMMHSKELSDAFHTPPCLIDTAPLINAWVEKIKNNQQQGFP